MTFFPILAIPEAILTSTGLIEAAWTLMRTWSGPVIFGVGRVAMSYSVGLLYFGNATACIDAGIAATIALN